MAVGSIADLKNKKLGRAGERKACAYLKTNGYKIIERNYKNPFGEVDIIASKGDVIIFAEVKTRLSDAFGSPSEAVTYKRRQKYVCAVNYYFIGREPNCTVRFDIIEIYNGQIIHIENAF